eukprot:TRINITY_DN4073_c0_g1_i4.p2 TRINITY_DN4073_c0_g1~~TRINITY_DN4073_c0_g1_i4.p2  ORF type:complete len:150 (-),score=35.98 TRINITY_DN4073_c0_g1_i4:50-499(-)
MRDSLEDLKETLSKLKARNVKQQQVNDNLYLENLQLKEEVTLLKEDCLKVQLTSRKEAKIQSDALGKKVQILERKIESEQQYQQELAERNASLDVLFEGAIQVLNYVVRDAENSRFQINDLLDDFNDDEILSKAFESISTSIIEQSFKL